MKSQCWQRHLNTSRKIGAAQKEDPEVLSTGLEGGSVLSESLFLWHGAGVFNLAFKFLFLFPYGYNRTS